MKSGVNPKTKYLSLAAAAIALIIIVFLIGAKIHQNNKDNPVGVWEALVVLRSQQSGASPAEDAKNSLKRGDAIAVRPEHHVWSETEYKSYLLVKIEGRKQDAEKLLLPLEKESGQKDEQGRPQKEIIRARRYAVDMDKIGFAGDQVISGQPVENKIFKIDVIKEK